MKTTIINTSDINGGAALAGYSLFQALNRFTEFETRILCGRKYSHDANIQSFITSKLRFLDKFINDFFIKRTVGQNYWLPSKKTILSHQFITDADIFNLHNIHGNYFAYPTIKKLSNIAPIVITMHDMWYMTGHCSYAYDCSELMKHCKNCPHLERYPELKRDNAGFHWRKKLELYENCDITFVTCSEWLKNEAEKSLLFKGKKIHHIYNPINTENLKPRPKKLLRKLLDIPQDKCVIAFGAARIDNVRKGFPAFISKITERFAKKNNLFLVIMGSDPDNFVNQIPPWLPFKSFGNIPRDDFKSFVFGCSDVFIFPTLADNLSNMLIESLSSGTPCVTFNVGGCGEIIQNNFTGYLARQNDFDDFFSGIELILNDSNLRKNLAENARTFVLDNFTYEICANRYSRLFRSILDK